MTAPVSGRKQPLQRPLVRPPAQFEELRIQCEEDASETLIRTRQQRKKTHLHSAEFPTVSDRRPHSGLRIDGSPAYTWRYCAGKTFPEIRKPSTVRGYPMAWSSAAHRPIGPEASGIKAGWSQFGTTRGAQPASPAAGRRDAWSDKAFHSGAALSFTQGGRRRRGRSLMQTRRRVCLWLGQPQVECPKFVYMFRTLLLFVRRTTTNIGHHV